MVGGVRTIVATALLAAVGYALTDLTESSVLALSFICGLPIVMGILSVLLAPAQLQTQPGYGVMAPAVSVVGLAVLLLLIGIEFLVCIVMGLPVYLFLACGAGLLTVIIRQVFEQPEKSAHPALALLILLPHLLAAAESTYLTMPESINQVDSTRIIAADAETVWQNIIAVPEIQDDERPFSVLALLQFPLPMEATLSGEGLGGMRHAVYNNGLMLLEPVTVWQPQQAYAFAVQLDPNNPPPKPFDQLNGDVLGIEEVRFTLQEHPDGTQLTLTTTYRVSTLFNPLAEFWVDVFLRDLHHTILSVITSRAEGNATAQNGV